MVINFIFFIVGIWYIMWDHIGKVAEHKESMEFMPSESGNQGSIDSETGKLVHDGLFLFADCRSSIKGMFLG